MNDDDELPRYILADLPRPTAGEIVRPDFGFVRAAALRRRAGRRCHTCDAPLGPRKLRYCSELCFRFRP